MAVVEALAIDPTTPATLYAGTRSGVFKSIDAGLHWAGLGLGVLDCQALVIDAADSDVVYAGGLGADDVSVYKSVDGGANWVASPVEEFTNALALLGSTTLLAATNDVGMFKTTDAAATWAPSNTGLVATAVLSLATNPAQPGSAYAGTVRNGVVRTTNGGDSWNETTPFYTVGVTAVAFDPATPGTAYAGDGATHGVFKTIDDGATWNAVGLSNGAPVNAYALVVDPSSPSNVYAGGVLEGVLKSPNGGQSWTSMNTGLWPIVLSMAIDPSAPATLYAGTDPVGAPFSGVFKTTNGGTSWSPVNTGLPGVDGMGVDGTGRLRNKYQLWLGFLLARILATIAAVSAS